MLGLLIFANALLLSGHALAETETHTYDALGRLTDTDYSSGGSLTYSFDPAGNLTQRIDVNAPVWITLTNGTTVLAPHTSTYSCWSFFNYDGTFDEGCRINATSEIVLRHSTFEFFVAEGYWYGNELRVQSQYYGMVP